MSVESLGTTVDRCAECGAEIVACDNGVNLDYPAVPYDDYGAMWTIMNLGQQRWAASGGPSPEGLGHTLHAHQPPEV